MPISNLNSVRFQFVAEARNASLFSTRSFIADGEIDEIIFFVSQLLFPCIFPEENFKTIATGS